MKKLLVIELAPTFLPKLSNGAPALKAVVQKLPASVDPPKAMSMVAPGLARIGHTNVSPAAMLEYTQNLHAVSELRDALNAPEFDFQLDYASGAALRLDFLAHLKGAEILTSSSVLEALQAGDFSEARADLLASVDVIRMYNKEPLLISGLVRVAMARIALGATWEALQADQWEYDSQLADLQAHWQGLEFLDTTEPTLNIERAMMIDAFAVRERFTTPRSPGLLQLSRTPPPAASFET